MELTRFCLEIGTLVRSTGAILEKSGNGQGPWRKDGTGIRPNDIYPTSNKPNAPPAPLDPEEQRKAALRKNGAPTLADFVSNFKNSPNGIPGERWFADGLPFKFSSSRMMVDCTAFVVGDHIIATTGHSIFGNRDFPRGEINPKNMNDWYFVVGVTTDNTDIANPITIPAQRIYELDRYEITRPRRFALASLMFL